MNRVKFIVLTLILVVGFSIPGCNPELDCDCPPVAKFRVFDQINLTLLANNAELAAGDTVRWSDLTVGLDLDVFFTGHLETKPLRSGGFSLLPSALACSCLWNGYEGLENAVVDLDWVTHFAYDVEHPAKGDFKDLIQHEGSTEYIDELNEFVNIQEFEEGSERFPFTISQAPQDTVPFQLFTSLIVEGGDTFTAESVEIVLVP